MSSRIYSTEDVSEFDPSVNGSSQDEVLDIKGDQLDPEDQADVDLLNLKSYDLWALGLTTAIGGHFFAWSSGLTGGFGSYIVSLFLISLAYYSLILCIAELSSALPFAGGVYGIARVTLGVYPGFLVAVMDSYKSILSTASGAWAVGRMMVVITQGDEKMQFLYWFLFYLYCLAINGYGGQTFWRINKVSASISLTLLLVFIFGSIKFAHFNENAPLTDEQGVSRWFDGGFHHFMLILSAPSRFFVGIQSINLACGQIKNKKTEVPKAYTRCINTVMLTCVAVSFLACSLPPGTLRLALQSQPLTPGYAQMFGVLPRYALIISVTVTVIYGSTYVYFFGQQIRAMGNSGLIHPIFGYDSPRNTPVFAHLAGSIIGYAVCVTEYYFDDVRRQLNNITMLGAMGTYISILVSYILFHNHFSSIKREYTSPLGSYGAVYSIIIFALCMISIAGFQKDHGAIIAFAILLVVVSVYYYLVVIKRQVFSEEEKKVLFTAYLVKNNRSKAQRIKKGTLTRARSNGNLFSAPSHGNTNINGNININSNRRADNSGVLSSARRGEDTSITLKLHPHSTVPTTSMHNHSPNSAAHTQGLGSDSGGGSTEVGMEMGCAVGAGAGASGASVGSGADATAAVSGTNSCVPGGSSDIPVVADHYGALDTKAEPDSITF